MNTGIIGNSSSRRLASLAAVALGAALVPQLAAQYSITSQFTPTTVDFGALGYTGAGLQPGGGAGTLDSNNFLVLGGGGAFATTVGGTFTGAPYNGGTSGVAPSVNVVYAGILTSGGPGFAIRPDNSGPADLVIRILNSLAVPITDIEFSADVFYQNDNARFTMVTLAHGSTANAPTLTPTTYSTPTGAANTATFVTGVTPLSTTINGLSIAPGATYFLTIRAEVGTGQGSVDAVAFNNITFQAVPEASSYVAGIGLAGMALLMAKRSRK